MQDSRIFDKATLVIGGTGMLAQATHWLARHSPKTLVVARHASPFVAGSSQMLACDADWNQNDFVGKLTVSLGQLGAVGQALIWLHDCERHLPQLMAVLGGSRVVVILGSMDRQPQIPSSAGDLVTVRLGSMQTADGSRWLTHGEISSAAIEALVSGKSCIVGDLRSI